MGLRPWRSLQPRDAVSDSPASGLDCPPYDWSRSSQYIKAQEYEIGFNALPVEYR